LDPINLEETIDKFVDEDSPKRIYGLNENKMPDLLFIEKQLSRRSAIYDYNYKLLKNNCRSTRNRCFPKCKFFLQSDLTIII
jgi:hypothetical protein